MKLYANFFAILGLLLVFSCQDKPQKKYLLTPTGPINSVAVVIDNQLWKGALGDTLRHYLAQPVQGIPGMPEALFAIHQIPPTVFQGNTRSSRNVLVIESGEPKFIVRDSVYAKSQKVVILTEKTTQKIMQKIREKSSEIIKNFKDNDIRENQNRFKKSLANTPKLSEKLKIDWLLPSHFSQVKQADDFFWFERRIKGGTTNIILYELPWFDIPTEKELQEEVIITIRDAAGKRYIPGREKGMYMITSTDAPINVYPTKIDGIQALESKGLWEMKDFLLGGPFVNYIIQDKKNNRLLVAEGFVLAPGIAKRDHLFEMESVIKSIRLKK